MIKELVDTWDKGVKSDLVANYNRLGLRASGKWEQELESQISVSETNINIKYLGAKYTEQLQLGRKPNINQDPSKLHAWVGWAGSTFLKDWVKDKGLSINPFAVAYKIAREGIKVPNAYNKGGLVSNVITKSKIQELVDKLGIFIINDIKSDIINVN